MRLAKNTQGSAYAEFQEKHKGSVTPGKLADLVLISDNILSIDPQSIRNAKVEMTMVGGKIVYGGPPQLDRECCSCHFGTNPDYSPRLEIETHSIRKWGLGLRPIMPLEDPTSGSPVTRPQS